MKFEVRIYRNELRDVQVFGATRDEAVQRALESNPGFSADGVVELGDGDEPVKESTLFGRCESCESFIWEGDKYASDEDGILCCEKCMEGA
jgi:hypothetical protein